MGTKVKIGGTLYPLLKINGVEVPKIIEYSATAPKLWSSDTGRDLAGNNKGTLLGIFTKIKVKTGALTSAEYIALSTQLDKANITVQYYDSGSGHILQEIMYANDRDDNMMSAKRLNTKQFSFNLIANRNKRNAVVIV